MVKILTDKWLEKIEKEGELKVGYVKVNIKCLKK